MTAYSTAPAPRDPPSFGIGKLVFVLILAVLFFLLGQNMVRHNFHHGQREHRNGSVGQ